MFESNITKIVKNFDLTSALAVAKAGGTITGSPTFSRDGCDFDGSNDYISYAIPNTLLSHAKISIIVEFTPDFAYDENAKRYLVSSTASNLYKIFKENNAGSNTLNISLGNVAIASIASVAYSAYWKQNERNVLVVSGTSGDTDCWLNDEQILKEDASVWTVMKPTELYIGSTIAGGYKFDGEIHSVLIKNDLTTDQEVQDLCNNSTFNFQNKAAGCWDFKSVIGVTATTRDKSGLGDDATINGCTFLNPGLSFDGSDDYLSDLTDPTGTYTVAIHQKVSNIETVEFESGLITWNKIITSGNFAGNLYHLAWFPFTLIPIQERQLNLQWLTN